MNCAAFAHESGPIFKDPALTEAFNRQGYVVIDLLDGEQVEQLLAAYRRSAGDGNALPYTSTVFSRDLAFRTEMFRRVAEVFEPRVKSLLDGYRVLAGGIIKKLPQNEWGVVALHQDPSVVYEPRYVGINLWCPLVDVEAHNGCLRVVPGSHRLNRRPRDASNIDFPYPELLPRLMNDYLAEIPMRAGQAFVYTQSLFHSSPPNRSDEVRLVAGCMAIPLSAKATIFVRDAERHPGQLAAFELSDEDYRSYCLGERPDESGCIGLVADAPEPLTEARLHELLGGQGAG